MPDLHLPVGYYDNERDVMGDDEHGLEAYVPVFDQVVADGIDVDPEELLAYSMYARAALKTGAPISFKRAKRLVPAFERAFRSSVRLGKRLQQLQGQDVDGFVVEGLGVGSSLLLATRAFDCLDADFADIPVAGTKTLDYSNTLTGVIAGKKLLELECKGSTSRVSTYNAIKDIRAKKKEAPPKKRTVRLGTVLEIGEDRDTSLMLVDPPGADGEDADDDERLMRRLTYYLQWLRLISRSELVTALANRLDLLLRRAVIPAALNLVPLLRSDGEPMLIRETFLVPATARSGVLAHGRPFLLEMESVGLWTTASALYIGLHVDVLRALAASDHNFILKTKSSPNRYRLSRRGRIGGSVVNTPGGIFVGYVSARWPKGQDPPTWLARDE